MTPSEVEGLIKIVEFVIKTFGVSAAPLAVGVYIYFQSRKATPDKGAGVAGELRDDVKAIRADVADMKIRMAVVETKLEERRE